jgi:hypothetical protein
MLDLRIESLRIDMSDASGHEHRIHEIASRAALIFGERLSERFGENPSLSPAAVDGLQAKPVEMNLNHTSDERAARSIADSWLEALALRLKL